MRQTDGLYLKGVWVATADNIATTYQANDLTKPDSMEVSYAYSFDLPDSLLIRELTANAEQLDSASPDPYQALPAFIIDTGERVFSGLARLESFSGGWSVTLYEDAKNLFDRLDRSLRTADLSQFDHPWTLDGINALTDATSGVCYPLIDYGRLSMGKMPTEAMFPGIYVHTLVAQLLHEEGYTLTGNLPTDELYKRLVIPFTDGEPTSRDEQWQQDRKANVSLQVPDDIADRGALDSGSFVNRTQPYDLDNLPDQGLEQGKLKPFDRQTHSYVCDSAMRVRCQIFQQVKIRTISASVEALLSIERNGQEVAKTDFTAGTGYNLMNTAVISLQLDELIDCQKGDQLRVHLIVRRKTKVGNFQATVYNNTESSRASFLPDLATRPGDTWPVARNLPDLTGKTLLVALANLYCGRFKVDPLRRQVSLVRLTEVVNDVAGAVDWSDRVDSSVEPSWTPKLEPYAQANLLKWKEDEDTLKAGVAVAGLANKTAKLAYGDGIIRINANTLDTETTLFELPFAACLNSLESVRGYGNPVFIKLQTVSTSGGSSTGAPAVVNQQTSAPRLLLVEPGLSFPVPTARLAPDGITEIPAVANLMTCWFGVRPDTMGGAQSALSLCFSKPVLSRGEVVLIERNFGGLERVLRRMRVLRIKKRLLPTDISDLNLDKPIHLGRLQVGSLVINSSFYYVNKIENYQSGRPAMVVLIGF